MIITILIAIVTVATPIIYIAVDMARQERALDMDILRGGVKMANVTDTITIVFERRPCYVDGRKAMFHQWGTKVWIIRHSAVWSKDNMRRFNGESFDEVNEEICTGYCAIVEYEDGKVDRVAPESVQFADGGGFKEVAFRE